MKIVLSDWKERYKKERDSISKKGVATFSSDLAKEILSLISCKDYPHLSLLRHALVARYDRDRERLSKWVGRKIHSPFGEWYLLEVGWGARLWDGDKREISVGPGALSRFVGIKRKGWVLIYDKGWNPSFCRREVVEFFDVPLPEPKRCYFCRGENFWRGMGGIEICERCFPKRRQDGVQQNRMD